jgi:hypothetical protein
LVRPATKRERGRSTSPLLRPLRQIIESVNTTLKTQLDLERTGEEHLVAYSNGFSSISWP